jgi:hypothetical protein
MTGIAFVKSQHAAPFLVPNIRSSGSNTKSNPLPDFWTPNNEEPLDENRLSIAKDSFLSEQPTARVCAEPTSSPMRRRLSRSISSPLGDIVPEGEYFVPVPWGASAVFTGAWQSHPIHRIALHLPFPYLI